MINKLICIFLLILYLLLIYKVYNEISKRKFSNTESFQLFKTYDKSIEKFENSDETNTNEKVNAWTSTPDEINTKTAGLNSKQKKEVTNMIKVKVDQHVKDALNDQQTNDNGVSEKFQSDEQGQMGPPGGEYLANGLLINKEYSMDSNNQLKMSVSRLHGEGNSGKAYLDEKDAFSPTTYWYLNKDGHLKNRFDDNCLTTSGIEKSDLYMSKCSDSPNQIWKWDNRSNRLVLKDDSNQSSKVNCIGLSGKKFDENTALTTESKDDKYKRYLQLKKCDSSVKPDEVWSFT